MTLTLTFDLLTSKREQFISDPRCITDKSLVYVHQCIPQISQKQHPGRTHGRTYERHKNIMPYGGRDIKTAVHISYHLQLTDVLTHVLVTVTSPSPTNVSCQRRQRRRKSAEILVGVPPFQAVHLRTSSHVIRLRTNHVTVVCKQTHRNKLLLYIATLSACRTTGFIAKHAIMGRLNTREWKTWHRMQGWETRE